MTAFMATTTLMAMTTSAAVKIVAAKTMIIMYEARQ
tara:strand:+ start:913 stop:1020 length:108 start_codon:yes stop_codon:yes gene_type:complete